MSKRKRTSSSPSVPTGNDDSHSSEEEEQSRRPPPPHLASLAAPQLPQFRLPPRPPPPRSATHPPRPPVSPPQRRLPPPPPRRTPARRRPPPSRRPPPPIQHPLIHYLDRQNPVIKVRMPPPPTADSNPDIRPTTSSQPSPDQQRALTQATLAAIANFLEVDGPADQVPPSSSSASLHGPSIQARYPPPPRPPPPDIIDLSPANFLGDQNDPVIPQFQHPRPQAPAGFAQAAPRPAGPRPNKSPEIAPPYPWAGTRRTTVRTLEYLVSKGINLISGQSRCNICNKIYQMDLDLTRKFEEVSDIVRNQARRHMSWIDNPRYPDCPSCKSKNCLVPVINNPVKKRNVNWLFLLLGQWIACCRNTPQLRYFLKHNGIDYPNATSDLQLYLTFLAICKQLRPGDKLFDPYY